MKQLKFAMGLLDYTLWEEKTITIRRYRPEAHNFKTGEVFIGDFFEDFEGTLLLLVATSDTQVLLAKDITLEDARADGFKDINDMFESMKEYYPDFNDDTQVGIIRFRKAKPTDL